MILGNSFQVAVGLKVFQSHVYMNDLFFSITFMFEPPSYVPIWNDPHCQWSDRLRNKRDNKSGDAHG